MTLTDDSLTFFSTAVIEELTSIGSVLNVAESSAVLVPAPIKNDAMTIENNNFIYRNRAYDMDRYTKIFIDLDRPKLDRWLYLFFKKVLVTQDSSFDNLLQERVFEKLYWSLHYELDLCKGMDKSLFDYVVPFSKLYDWDYLNDLKFKISGKYSNKKEIVDKTNQLSDVDDMHIKTIVDIASHEDPYINFSKNCFGRYLEIVT